MNLNDLIAQLSSPDNQTTNLLRSQMNEGVASEQANLGEFGASQGWGGRSGMLGKLRTGVSRQGFEGLTSGLLGAEQNRMQLLLNAIKSQEMINEQQRERKMAFWAEILKGIGSGAGMGISAGLMKIPQAAVARDKP